MKHATTAHNRAARHHSVGGAVVGAPRAPDAVELSPVRPESFTVLRLPDAT
jgi:hypothetical protein